MVQIVIKNDAEVSQWTLIELQGDLESKCKTSLAGCFMGDLHYNVDGTPILIIGHHILYGKVIDMDKPFAVLFKKKRDAPGEAESIKNKEINSADASNHTEYLVRAIIRKKLVFKTRPKPIVTNVAKKL